MRRRHARDFLVDAGQKVQRARRLGQAVGKAWHIRHRLQQQPPPQRAVVVGHAAAFPGHQIGDARPTRPLAQHQPGADQLAQGILDVRHIVPVGQAGKVLDRLRAVVHPDDVQKRVFRPGRRKVADRGQAFRLPAPESLGGPHQREFQFRGVDLDRAFRQMPAQVETGGYRRVGRIILSLNHFPCLPPRAVCPRSLAAADC